MGSRTTTTASGGRERAIEALIDRESAGDFYRAARVLVRFVRWSLFRLDSIGCFLFS
jgi:hypothetical protein